MITCTEISNILNLLFQASFVASGNRTDISLDDPNFWQKWAKKAELDIDALNGRVSVLNDLSFSLLKYYVISFKKYLIFILEQLGY